MKEFDRIKCIDNITYVVKELGKKLGEVEVNAGGSAGGLSRLRNNEGRGNFSVEFFYNIAEQLGHTMDYLANYDPDAPITENDKFILRFLDQLTFDAENQNTVWEMMDANILRDDYMFEHPLFSRNTRIDEHPITGDFVQRDVMYFDSQFDETAEIAGHCYFANLNDDIGSTIYVMCCRYKDRESKFGGMTEAGYEMYFIDKKGNITPVASSFLVSEPVRVAMKALYEAIESAKSHLNLNAHSRSVINRYMAYAMRLSKKEDEKK